MWQDCRRTAVQIASQLVQSQRIRKEVLTNDNGHSLVLANGLLSTLHLLALQSFVTQNVTV